MNIDDELFRIKIQEYKPIKYLSSKINENIAIIYIFFLSLIPLFTWFKDDFFIARGDIFPQFHALKFIKLHFLYVWSGYPHILSFTDSAAIFPWMSFWAFLSSIGVDSILIQRLWYVLNLFLSGLSIYYLSSIIISEKNNIGSMVSATFYMFNTFSLMVVGNISYFSAYAVLPLLLGIALRGLKSKDNKYIFIFILVWIFGLDSALNFAVFTITSIILFIFLFFYSIFVKGKKKSNIIYLFKIFIFFILVNSFWIISVYISLSGNVVQIDEKISLNEAKFQSESSTILNIFRLGILSYVFFNESSGYPYSEYYFSTLAILATLLIPILVFTANFLRPKDINIIFISSFSLFFIFLAKGISVPMPFINEFLYQHIPGFIIFRSPWKIFDFAIILGFALLIGISINELLKRLRDKNSIIQMCMSFILILLFLSIVFISAWPMVVGDHFSDKPYPHHAKIPSYWFEANEWFNADDDDYRIFSTPKNTFHLHFNWETTGERGTHLVPGRDDIIIEKPLVNTNPVGQYYEVGNIDFAINLFYKALYLNTTKIGNLMSLMNVKYILQRNDLDWTYYGYDDVGSQDFIHDSLILQDGIVFKESIGELDIYELDKEYYVPIIYGTSNLVLPSNIKKRWSEQDLPVNLSINEINALNIILSDDFKAGNTVILNNGSIPEEKGFSGKNYPAPRINISKINPTKYRVLIDTKQPFYLVFSEPHHIGWKVYENEINWLEAFWKKPLSEDNHFLANYYSNAWYLDKVGNYEMIIYFKPQSTYFIGLIISLTTLLISISYLILHYTKKKGLL